MTIDPSTTTRLEKAALDNGFDRELAPVGNWLAFGSTHAHLALWLQATVAGQLAVALSRADVAKALTDHGGPSSAAPPAEAAACLQVGTIPELNGLLRRAYQLARALPHQLLHDFEQKTAGMPRATEAERLVVQRVGQDVFRAGLMDYWEGKCAVTGLAVPELLRASHIKPWADCETDAERLDVFNGLLLAPHLDAAFDRGFITVAEDGAVLVSTQLGQSERRTLGLELPLRSSRISDSHRSYLAHHWGRVFRA
jgi:hypothetical protein